MLDLFTYILRRYRLELMVLMVSEFLCHLGQQVTEVVGGTSTPSVDQTKVVNILDLVNSLTHKHDLSYLFQKGIVYNNTTSL